MVEKQKSTTAAGAGNRAAIACRSCRQRKVKASRVDALPPRRLWFPVLTVCSVTYRLFHQKKAADHAAGPGKNASWILCRMDDGARLSLSLIKGRSTLTMADRTVNRKCVARLQQRIEMLEARSREGRWIPSDDGLSDHTSVDYTPLLLPCGPRLSSIADTIPPPPPPPPPPLSNGHGRVETGPLSADGSSPGCTTSSYGSPSFYGATCHPHVVSSIEDPQLFAQDGDAVGIGIGIDLDPTSPHLRAHLFQSYFKYQTLWVDVVDKLSFLSHQASGNYQSRWCSRFLENAMLACGTRLSTSKSVRALGPKYCEWAKLDVLRAMSDPTPANLQGFLLLSEYEVSQGNDRPGWMYCGVACRMLSDLGLHELAGIADDDDAPDASSRESDLAYALLSACVVYEGVWTLYLGRPSSIPRSVMDIVARRCKQHRKADTPWLNAWVGLCVPMAEITRVLNDKAAGAADRLASLRRLAAQVDDWYRALPPELAYNKDRLINMHLAGYGIHSQYCKVQILLQRALAKQQPQQPAAPPPNPRKRPHAAMADDGAGGGGGGMDGVEAGGSGGGGGGGGGRDGSPTPAARSEAIAYQYAQRVARMVVTYREAFGMEHIPSIMLDNSVVAATAMIRHLTARSGARDGAGDDDDVWLRQLLICMDSMTAHFPVIARMLESLKQICGNGPLQSLLPPARRGSTEAPVREQNAGGAAAENDGNRIDNRNGNSNGTSNGTSNGASNGASNANANANANGNSIVVSVNGHDGHDDGSTGESRPEGGNTVNGLDRANGAMGHLDPSGNANHGGHSDHSDNHQDTSMADDAELLWDCFDTSMGPGIGVFPSAAFGDFVLDMPPPTVLGSTLS